MSPLEQLVSMGFPEEIARSTLEAHGFDLERSIDALIGQSASTDSRLSEVNRPAFEVAVNTGLKMAGTTAVEKWPEQMSSSPTARAL